MVSFDPGVFCPTLFSIIKVANQQESVIISLTPNGFACNKMQIPRCHLQKKVNYISPVDYSFLFHNEQSV